MHDASEWNVRIKKNEVSELTQSQFFVKFCEKSVQNSREKDRFSVKLTDHFFLRPLISLNSLFCWLSLHAFGRYL
jgi:hypothetical protein